MRNCTSIYLNIIYSCCWLASAVILGLNSRWTRDHILLSQIRDAPNLKDQVPVFLSPRNRVAQFYTPGTGFSFRRLLRLAGLGNRVENRVSEKSQIILLSEYRGDSICRLLWQQLQAIPIKPSELQNDKHFMTAIALYTQYKGRVSQGVEESWHIFFTIIGACLSYLLALKVKFIHPRRRNLLPVYTVPYPRCHYPS
jgi:hypothetical protein